MELSEMKHLGMVGGSASKIAGLFQQMGEAEEEIDKAIGLYPLMAPALRSAFLALQPTVYLGMKEQLYRPHVVELLGRVVEGKDLRDPTAAEMMGLMAETSHVTPLLAQGAALYFRLFRELFPAEADSQNDEKTESCVTRGEYGRYPGDVEEMREILRKKMRREIETTVAGRGKP